MNQELTQQEQTHQNTLLIQKAVNRLFNTDDGKTVLAHLMNEFVLSSSYVPSVSAVDIAYATGKADLVKLFFLTANANI